MGVGTKLNFDKLNTLSNLHLFFGRKSNQIILRTHTQKKNQYEILLSNKFKFNFHYIKNFLNEESDPESEDEESDPESEDEESDPESEDEVSDELDSVDFLHFSSFFFKHIVLFPFLTPQSSSTLHALQEFF
jgi:hypothetical protein